MQGYTYEKSYIKKINIYKIKKKLQMNYTYLSKN
jgi:hypothetical protein